MSREARARLAAAQAEVVRALMAPDGGDGAVPAGFDREQMRVARQVLRDKQERIAHRRAEARNKAGNKAGNRAGNAAGNRAIRPRRPGGLVARLREMLVSKRRERW